MHWWKCNVESTSISTLTSKILTIPVTYQVDFLNWYQTLILQYLHKNLTNFSLWWLVEIVLSSSFVCYTVCDVSSSRYEKIVHDRSSQIWPEFRPILPVSAYETTFATSVCDIFSPHSFVMTWVKFPQSVIFITQVSVIIFVKLWVKWHIYVGFGTEH